jgi:hypothetical protein
MTINQNAIRYFVKKKGESQAFFEQARSSVLNSGWGGMG